MGRFTTTFGFDIEEDGDKILDVQRSFFRFVRFPRAPLFFNIVTVCACIIQFVCLIVSISSFHTHCSAHTFSTSTGPNCIVSWILSGPNQVSFATFLYFFLVIMNVAMYGKQEVLDHLPKTILVQWVLFVILAPFSVLSIIAYMEKLAGATHPESVRADKWSAMGLMAIYSVVGLVDVRPRHILFNVIVLVCHLIFVVLCAAISGHYVYEPTQTLNGADLIKTFAWECFLLLSFSTLLYLVHVVKVAYFAGGTLMRPAVVATTATVVDTGC
jgi:hypothetical protein